MILSQDSRWRLPPCRVHGYCPTALPSHRDRLVRLLHTAVAGLHPEQLRLCEVHWGERDLLTRGRFVLPPHTLVRWHVPALSQIDRAAVMQEAHRIHPDLAVFDFGRIAGLEALAWLGPLKLEVLHRLIDALEDCQPVATASEIGEQLQHLEQVLGLVHPLPERVRAAPDLDAAIATVAGFIAF